MKTDLCADDMVVQLATPQLMAVEGVVGEGAAAVAGGGGGVGAEARAVSAAVEFGRRLLVAARAGDTDTVKLLMAKGAPFTTDWLGTSPLHLAAANDHVETVAVLLRAGVSRDARTKVDRTPLHLAAAAGHARTVAALCRGGAQVDARDLLQMTPLHWAVAGGHGAAAHELLAHGADPHAASKFRKTPLSLAAARPRPDPALLRLVQRAASDRTLAPALPEQPTSEEAAPATPTIVPGITRIQKITEIKTSSPKKLPTSERKYTKTTLKMDSAGAPASAGGGGGVAEALLRRHGITLLPHDDTNTVLSALQSGRTVVLSDAGKLMLKESNSGAGAGAGAGEGEEQGQGQGEGMEQTGAGAGVVLRATPVSAPPPGVKVFTLNSSAKLRACRHPAPAVCPSPAPAPTTPAPAPAGDTDVQQVKLVQLGGGGGGGGGGGARGAVRIIMNKHNFRKLIATATRAAQPESAATEPALEDSSGSEEEAGGGGEGGGGGDGSESVVVVPEQFVRSVSPQYLRSQLLCAHAALHHLTRRLRRAHRRLRMRTNRGAD